LGAPQIVRDLESIARPHDLQELDFGTDYCAMQSFWDGKRQSAPAWLFNWESRKPAGSAYSGEMSLPRILSVNADRELTMRPEPAYKTLRSERLVVDRGRFSIRNRQDAVELELCGDVTKLSTSDSSFPHGANDWGLLSNFPP
jgi:beta-fructofuranosidase